VFQALAGGAPRAGAASSTVATTRAGRARMGGR
jgi:hypothetical protein